VTCEIAVMNRHAVALAADSAVTVMQWSEGKPQPRYFKGANKIFQLSHDHPVGMMIYDSATLHEVPWELIVKDFRKSLGDKSFNEMAGYAEELFRFIKEHAHLYPAEYQATLFKDEAEKHGWAFLFGAGQDDSVTKAADAAAKTAAYDAFFATALAEVEKQPVAAPFEAADVDTAAARFKGELAAQLKASIERYEPDTSPHVDCDQLSELGIKAIFRKPTALMAPTGVVIAGYGDHEFFPGYEEYKCYGLLHGKFLFEKVESQKIAVDKPAYINGFATTSMIMTFESGYSPDVFNSVVSEFGTILKNFAEKVKSEVGAADVPNLETHLKEARAAHTRSWAVAARRAHYWPLIRVIGALPLDEMADLAETLIVLQSLKEKVTQPSESVGGPVDVAIISKGDGFIWRKRKHYFDAKLNPRFFQRQRQRGMAP